MARTGGGFLPGAQPLKRLEAAARVTENIMPPILKTVEAYVTPGEMRQALRSVFGEQREFLAF